MNFKITILTLLITFHCFAQDNWQTYTKDNYTIDYPSDWTYSNQKPQPTIQFVLKASPNSAKNDQFQENINLNLEFLKQDKINLDSYINTTIKQILSQVNDAQIIENKLIKSNDLDAKLFVWSGSFGNGIVLKFRQLVFIKNKTAYVLTLTCTETDYESYINIGNKIFNSFKFKN
ncbi:PsbP-related protein [Ichthyenterobacterium magnum]|uniref:PsbP protein n=1 Tax=Ichthyenterobacterium magnum TaxID=1230530 RepID=A0A420DVP1_9FLAO|nr:PsbP-related protein [Ichthyenterobacterium magnum]RKE98290.1 hypothetical protein BXY80_0369 [Ichthyenterobacterium magnum]